MNKIILNEGTVGEIISLYETGLMGTRKIGEQFNLSREVVQRVLKENGVELKNPGRRWEGGKSEAQKKYVNKPDVKNVLKEYYKQWGNDNKEHRKKYHKQWRDENAEHVRDYKRKKQSEYLQDSKYKLAQYTRTAVWTCLKERSINKYKSTFDMLPFTLDELITHLELLFEEGMTWDNYGEWHLDHKIPMSYFDIKSYDDSEFIKCWSLENLKPMWAHENLSKNNHYIG